MNRDRHVLLDELTLELHGPANLPDQAVSAIVSKVARSIGELVRSEDVVLMGIVVVLAARNGVLDEVVQDGEECVAEDSARDAQCHGARSPQCRSWAARFLGSEGQRPVEDIGLLVLGESDRLYAAIEGVDARLGRPVQVTIRDSDWLTTGDGSFDDTVVSRPMVPIDLEGDEPSAG